jgi:hypothetical protein
VNIDARRMADNLTRNEYGKDAQREQALLDKYDPGPERKISEATLVVDKYNYVLAWFLPGVLSQGFQVGQPSVDI